MRRFRSILALTAAAFLCAPVAALAAPNYQYLYSLAMREYNAHEYSQSADHLRVILREQPENASAHYVLGCCCTQLNSLDSASEEFKNAIKYDRSGKIVPAATQALTAVTRALQSITAQNDAVTNSLAVIQQQTASEAPASWATLNQSANALATQLEQNTGSVRLVPGQTNLYLRTYTTDPSSPASPAADKETKLPEQLAADQEQLILQPVKNKLVSHVVPAPLAAGQDKLLLHGKDDKSDQLSVSGRITHK